MNATGSISSKSGGADQICERQPWGFDFRLGFGRQGGLPRIWAGLEGSLRSRSIGDRGEADFERKRRHQSNCELGGALFLGRWWRQSNCEFQPLGFERRLGFRRLAGLERGGAYSKERGGANQ